MHPVHDPGDADGRREHPDRRRQRRHFQPDAGGEGGSRGSMAGRKGGGDGRPARAPGRTHLDGWARPVHQPFGDDVAGRARGHHAGQAPQGRPAAPLVLAGRQHRSDANPQRGTTVIDFEQAIIADGSEPLTLPFIPASDPRIMDSTGALEVGEVPERLLILGGGIMGLEMATVYHELGAKVTIAELMDRPNAAPELATALDTLDRLAADHITKAGVPTAA